MHRAGRHFGWRGAGGDDDIRARAQPRQVGVPPCHHRAFVPVRVGVQQRAFLRAVAGRLAVQAVEAVQKGRLVAQRMAFGWFDQHHIGAEVAKQPRRPRAGQPVGQVHHAAAVERRCQWCLLCESLLRILENALPRVLARWRCCFALAYLRGESLTIALSIAAFHVGIIRLAQVAWERQCETCGFERCRTEGSSCGMSNGRERVWA